MTPKEKAIELVDKFTYEISGIDKYNYCLDSHIRFTAKQCVLIAVDEIMKVVSFYNDTQAEYYYWEEVQQEIEKL